MIKVGCVSLMVLSCVAYGRNYGKAGCGWGSQLMGKDGSQVFAATTNASGYNQFIGITMGTSNCAPDGASVAVMRQESFVTSNYANLSKEMAQGQGEALEGLAQVLGADLGIGFISVGFAFIGFMLVDFLFTCAKPIVAIDVDAKMQNKCANFMN